MSMCNPTILKAYSVPDNDHHWVVPCPFCGCLHVHGAEEGRRHPHCPPDRRPPEGYVLQFAGKASRAMVLRYRRRSAAFAASVDLVLRGGRRA